jgi:hypothetical protein
MIADDAVKQTVYQYFLKAPRLRPLATMPAPCSNPFTQLSGGNRRFRLELYPSPYRRTSFASLT